MIVPDELLRLSPSQLERVRSRELRRIRLMAHHLLIQAESEAEKALLRGAMEMVARELERRVALYEARGMSG